MATITITQNMAKSAVDEMEAWQAQEARLEAEMNEVYATELQAAAQALLDDAERFRSILPFHEWKDRFRRAEAPKVRARDEYYTLYGRYCEKVRNGHKIGG